MSKKETEGEAQAEKFQGKKKRKIPGVITKLATQTISHWSDFRLAKKFQV